jgi:hypothetical protein
MTPKIAHRDHTKRRMPITRNAPSRSPITAHRDQSFQRWLIETRDEIVAALRA